MGHKEKASEKLRRLHFNSLSKALDEAIKRHTSQAYVVPGEKTMLWGSDEYHWKARYGGEIMPYHSVAYWDREIAIQTTNLPDDERISPERLKQLLEGKVGPLLDNNCVQCGRLVKYLSEKYKLD